MKLQQIVNSEKALGNLASTKLPIKIAYRVSRMIQKIEPELRNYREQRLKVFKEYGVEKETNTWEILPENIGKAEEELKKLLEEEVNIEFEKIKMDDLGDVQLEPVELLSLEWLFE